MIRKFEHTKSSIFIMHENNKELTGLGLLKKIDPVKTLIYNEFEDQKVTIDGIEYNFPKQTMLPLIVNQNFKFEYPEKLTAWQFNREFYCILKHDSEIGNIGFLFYGIDNPMFIKINEDEQKEIQQIKINFQNEWNTSDVFQGEMLKTLLKQLMIKVARIAKSQTGNFQKLTEEKLDIVRQFIIIVENNYKKEHGVKYYADYLNKSPKTLSNTFAVLKQQSPLRIIHNRIIIEAKRYLNHSNKTAKEIAFELGFESISHFSRFFKTNTGISISEFKKE